MPIKALGFRALLRPDKVELEREVKTESGLVVSLKIAADEKMEQNAQTIGTIVSLGEDFAKDYKPLLQYWGLKPGDKVYYAKYAGKWVADPETKEELLLVNDEDICGKWEPSNADSPVVAS